MDVLDKFFELGKMSQTLCESLSRIKRDDPVIYDGKKVYDFPTKVKNKTKIVHKHDQWFIKTTSYIPIPSNLHLAYPSPPDTEPLNTSAPALTPTNPIQETAVAGTVTSTETEAAVEEEEQIVEDVIEQLSTDSSQQSQDQQGEEFQGSERKDNLAFFVPEEAENGDASTQFAIDNYSQMYQF